MILNTDNALQFIEKVNTALSGASISQRLDDTMDANDVISTLNNVFSSYQGRVELTSSMDAEDVILAVNQNISLLGGGRNSVKFLHISDVHNSANADAITQCKSLLDSDNTLEFAFLTGDYSGYNGSYSNVTTALQSLGQKILMLNGNHDVYDGFSNNQRNATQFLKSIVVNSDVHWGDTNGVASYYYRDVILSSTSKLRIISVDSYDYRLVTGSKYDTIYTQEQVDWVVARMMELRSTDYLIIAMHEPPVNASTIDYSYNVSGKMDDDIVALRRSNPFCSARLWVWDTSLSNGNLFPAIVNAYQNRLLMSTDIPNKDSVTGEMLSYIHCTYDFRSIQPAAFLFYIGGHLHGDFAEYHPTYQNQLILLVDCANSSTLGNSSDIGARVSDTANGSRGNGILINEVTIDFANRETRISRIGQNAALSYNGFPSITRTNITFPFVKS